jgi:ABC-type transporter lipoprotein component MlaA
MIHIKRFIDKIASMEGKQGRDVVLPISDARALRDEITKLLLDQRESKPTQQTNEVIQVELKGGKW